MIFLAYLYGERVLYALYSEVMLKCFDIESDAFIRDMMNHTMTTTSVEQQQAHFWPEHRGVCWYMKIPYTERVWCDLLRHGTIQN